MKQHFAFTFEGIAGFYSKGLVLWGSMSVPFEFAGAALQTAINSQRP